MDFFTIRSLEEEIRLLNKVDHPHIARYYETYDEANYLYMVMEFCQGGDLYDKLLNDYYDGMSEKQASEIIFKIVKALLHCHDQNIMHRDLKPENIVFAESGEPKLIDFGFAKMHVGNDSWLETVGSPHYISPEALYGKYGKETDVWSLGVVIYQMLTGKLPFDDDNFPPKMSVINEKIRLGSFEMPESLSDNAKDLLAKMINYKNDERITFSEVVNHPWFTQPEDVPIDKTVLNSLKDFKSSNKLKTTVMDQLIKQLTLSSTNELKAQFESIDKDKNGVLDDKEIELAFESFEQTSGLSKQEFKKILKEVDTNGDGKINYNEFLAATAPLSKILTKEKLS